MRDMIRLNLFRKQRDNFGNGGKQRRERATGYTVEACLQYSKTTVATPGVHLSVPTNWVQRVRPSTATADNMYLQAVLYCSTAHPRGQIKACGS